MTRSTPYSSGEGWVEWHGGENPVPGRIVDAVWRGETHENRLSNDLDWGRNDISDPITAYRVVSPGLPVGGGQGSSLRDTQPGSAESSGSGAAILRLSAEKEAMRERAVRAEALLGRAADFIFDLGQDLHSRRVADWYPEGAHNAAEQMSEDMRLLGNACANFEPSLPGTPEGVHPKTPRPTGASQ